MYWLRGWDLQAAYDHLTSTRACSPRVEAVRAATADLLTGSGPVPVTISLARRGTAKVVQVAGLDVGWHQRVDLAENPQTKRLEVGGRAGGLVGRVFVWWGDARGAWVGGRSSIVWLGAPCRAGLSCGLGLHGAAPDFLPRARPSAQGSANQRSKGLFPRQKVPVRPTWPRAGGPGAAARQLPLQVRDRRRLVCQRRLPLLQGELFSWRRAPGVAKGC
jgi:hypothetical protein